MPRKNPSLTIETNYDLQLDNPELEDHAAKKAVERRVLDYDFADKLKYNIVSQWGLDEDKISLEKIKEAKGVNSSSHFIAHNIETDKKFHIKAALHGSGISLGSKFNELAYYMLNGELKVGPRASGFVVNDVLMIATEDLSTRSINNAKNKKISFTDNEKKQYDQELNGEVVVKDERVDQIPARFQDSVHRCATEMVINLCFYADVQHNYGNTGIKHTEKSLGDNANIEIKEKVFIIDFRLSNENDIIKKYAPDGVFRELSKGEETAKYAAKVAKRLDGDRSGEFPKDLFNFDESSEVFKSAIRKLFVDEQTGEANKYQNAVNKSFDYAMKAVPENQYKQHHISTLKFQRGATLYHVNKFLENDKIKEVLQEIKKEIESSKPSPSPKSPELHQQFEVTKEPKGRD